MGIYLDNASTTFPKPENVYHIMEQANREYAVNTGRGQYSFASRAEGMVRETRRLLAELAHAKPGAQVILTPNATIAMNQIIGGLPFRNGQTIYVSAYEHNAVARCLRNRTEQCGCRVVQLPLRPQSLEIDLERTEYVFAKYPPDYVFITHVSNVTGYILPVREVIRRAGQYGAVTVVDGAQSFGLLPVDMMDWGADFMVFEGHKTLYGPFGCAGFIKQYEKELNVFLAGGTGKDSLNLDMPDSGTDRYEPGSLNTTAAAGLWAALMEIGKPGIRESFLSKERELTRILREGLKKTGDVIAYMPERGEDHIGICAFNIRGLTAAETGALLNDEYGIAVRSGYHCAPLIHSWLQDADFAGVVRASIGRFTTEEQIGSFLEAVREISAG